MATTSYPDQTRFAFRPGVTCVTTASGALLLNPPHSEKLTRITGSQLKALRTLNVGPTTISQISTPADRKDISTLLDHLTTRGWLTVTVCDGPQHLYSILPFRRPPPRRELQSSSVVLSKFSLLHRDSEGLVIEHPLAWCDLRIHDARLLGLLGGPTPHKSDVPTALASQFTEDLRWAGMLVSPGDEDHGFATRSWSAPDLWFHRRSTLGERTVTWENFGPTQWAKGQFPPPPARRMNYPGEAIALSVPDLTTKRRQDPTLTAVLEDRVSTRAFDDAHPISIEQLAELLYRTARTRNTQLTEAGNNLLSRPYPSGGGLYELELYPVVQNATGLEPGMFHYDSFDHVLRPVAAADSKAVAQLLRPVSATLTEGAAPQVLIIMAARCDRVMWTYEQIAYAAILKNVGVLMQTMVASHRWCKWSRA